MQAGGAATDAKNKLVAGRITSIHGMQEVIRKPAHVYMIGSLDYLKQPELIIRCYDG